MRYHLSAEEKNELNDLKSRQKIIVKTASDLADSILKIESAPWNRWRKDSNELRSKYWPEAPFSVGDQIKRYDAACYQLKHGFKALEELLEEK